MTSLKGLSCEACSADAPKIGEDEKRSLLGEIPNWQLVELDGEEQLQRVFRFRNFAQALTFTNAVGELAEAEGHHPAMLVEWGKVTVRWWTHKIGGLHKNDFIMSARTDAAYQS